MPIFWCAIVFGDDVASESLLWGPHAVVAKDSEAAVEKVRHIATAEDVAIDTTAPGHEIRVRNF